MKPSTLAKTSLVYAIAALASGVFFREFTKLNDFSGVTTLAFTHVHLLVLGTLLFLVLAIAGVCTSVLEDKRFKGFFVLHNIALPFMVIMLYVRGIDQVIGLGLPDAAIAGMAGLSHIALAVSLVLVSLCLIKAFKALEARV